MQWTNMFSITKKLTSVLLAVSMAVVLCCCSAQKTVSVSMYDLNKAMSDVAGFGDMQYKSSSDSSPEDLFVNISDMDYSKVDSFFINYATNGTGNADEIACIQVKNKGDVAQAVASLNAHLQKRIALYDTYDKSQSEKLSNAIVTSYGNVAVLIVGDKAKAMEKAFIQFMGEK